VPDAVTALVAAGASTRVLVVLDRSQLGGTPGPVQLLLGTAAATDQVVQFAGAKQDLFASAPAGLALVEDYEQLPLALAQLDSPEALAHLLADRRVARVVPDTVNTTWLAQSLPLIKQPAAALEGKDGTGTSIAVLDTGADYRVADLGSCTAVGTPASCRVVYAQDFATPDGMLDDSVKHGTNTASIAAAAAPGAQIIALDVFDGQGAATSTIINAINWVIANRATYHIASMNLSLGGGSFTGQCDSDPMAIALAGARQVGILAAVATGNNGTANAVSSPACASAAVSVGAVYDANVGALSFSSCRETATSADQVTCFSNSAPFQTLLAPGAFITAGGVSMAGTSQATPHVAGALAVLKGAFPDETPTELVARLTSSGKPVTDARTGRVLPRLDLSAASAGCVFRLGPAGLTLPSTDAVGALDVTTSAGCAWTVSSDASWLTVTSAASGAGSARLALHVSVNPGAVRTASLTVTGSGATVSLPVSQGVDTTPPTGTVTINGGATWTRTATVALAITASDLGGVASMCVTNTTTCTTYEPFATARAWTLTAAGGPRTVRVFFKDARGNATPLAGAASGTISLDTGLPTGALASVTSADATATLAWTAGADALSGLEQYRVVYATGATAPANCASGTLLYQGTALGYVHQGLVNGASYGYRVCAQDRAGNLSAGSAVVASPRPESVGPVASLTINGGAATSTSTAVTLTIGASDASPVTQLCLSTSATACTTWEPYAATRAYTLAARQGSATLWVRLKDAWGNVSAAPASATILLDTLAPVGGALTATAGDASVGLSWTAATDSTSGVAGYRVVFAAGTVAPASCALGTVAASATTSPFLHQGLTNGATYAYRVCAVDRAGNLAAGLTASAGPRPEATGPVGTVLINGGDAATRATAVTLTMAATDASRVTSMCVSATAACTAWEPYATTRAYVLPAAQGVLTVYARFRDEWGNTSAASSSDTIVLDSVLPTGGAVTSATGNGAITLTWTPATDATTGVSGYRVVYAAGTVPPASCAVGTLASASATSPFLHGSLTNGAVYAYRVCAVDGAGNVAIGLTATASPRPEAVGPVGTIVLAGGAAFTRTASVAATLSATDASGVVQMCLSTTASCTTWIPFSTQATVAVSASAGAKTVYARFKDTWGNVSAAAVTAVITLDATAPGQPVLTASAGSRQVALTWTAATDTGSGLAGYRLVALAGTALPATACATGTTLATGTATSFLHTGLTGGASFAYRLCAVDVAGNVSAGATRTATALP
jgi:hypothetical protein